MRVSTEAGEVHSLQEPMRRPRCPLSRTHPSAGARFRGTMRVMNIPFAALDHVAANSMTTDPELAAVREGTRLEPAFRSSR